jgi:hypothetical protein
MADEQPPVPSSAPVTPWLVADLLLDGQNPRLPVDVHRASQTELLIYMERYYDLEELGWSMVEHGYFDEEPLLVVPTDPASEQRIVLEGNRRLATLKLLCEEKARLSIGKQVWDAIAAAAAEKGHDLTHVPVRQYKTRQDLIEYLGFRHVSGLMQWEAEAKARFVYELISNYGYGFDQVARTIGSRSDAIRRQFIAWGAVEQARKAGVDVSQAVQRFGVLYRALQNPNTRKFLGLNGWIDGAPEMREPLSPGGTERFQELLGFIFGPDRVIKESRRLDDLGKALAEPVALGVLRQERDIDTALRELPEDRGALLAAMRTAYRGLTGVNGQAFQFVGDKDLIAEADRLKIVVGLILQTLGAPEGGSK